MGRFLLLDGDVLLPGNLVRHDLDWASVGGHKVDELAWRLAVVRPGGVYRPGAVYRPVGVYRPGYYGNWYRPYRWRPGGAGTSCSCAGRGSG